jgi:hypothetical protein
MEKNIGSQTNPGSENPRRDEALGAGESKNDTI